MNNDYASGRESTGMGAGTILGLLFIGILVPVAGYFGYRYFKAKPSGKASDSSGKLEAGVGTPGLGGPSGATGPEPNPNAEEPKSETPIKDFISSLIEEDDDDYSAGIFPLKKGSEGVMVKDAQAFFNKTIGAGLDVDGIFGKQTEAAVEKYFAKENKVENEITLEFYNTVIAPKMGKPVVK